MYNFSLIPKIDAQSIATCQYLRLASRALVHRPFLKFIARELSPSALDERKLNQESGDNGTMRVKNQSC